MRQKKSILRYWTALLLLIAVFSCSTVTRAESTPLVAVKLVDIHECPIMGITLMAWQAETQYLQASADTGKDGVALLALPPGRYFFTGDVTVLSSRAEYSRGLKDRSRVSFYYISRPLEVAEDMRRYLLAIDNSAYIDMTDISGLSDFQIHISQRDLGIEADVGVKQGHNWLRLYLPVRMQYTVQHVSGMLLVKWPFYAAPGMQAAISTL